MGKVAAVLALYEGGRSLFDSAKGLWREHLVYTVTVHENDYSYGEVHAWLIELVPTAKQRALTATTVSKRDVLMIDEDTENLPEKGVTLTFNDRKPKQLSVSGNRVTARMKRTEDQPVDTKMQNPWCIEFTCYTKAGQEAVVAKIEELSAARVKHNPVLRIVNNWGNWTRRSDIPLRSLESVILPGGQKESLVEDLRDFLAAEDEYVRLDLPWHRGYMLHGPPGTGKTSLVKALANEFKLDLWYIALGDLREESSLLNLLSEVSPRSIVLLEDVDTVKLTHDRKKDGIASEGGGRISLSSLLNALDGVATPHGLISFMTTNVFDTLDEALVRAGRMDRVEELVYPTWQEVDALFRRFFGEGLTPSAAIVAGLPSEPGISQAEASEVFKRSLGDPVGARLALAAVVTAKVTLT
jgi:chaperone BCS1